jgi:geranylgeranyl pyrophosphate synthase
MGAVAAGTGQAALAAVTEYGRRLGAAFQIVDDLLDVTASPEQLGKATNKDRSRGKNTYPALLGIDASRRAAQEHLAAAARAIEALGPPGRPLAALARFVVERTA